MGNCTIEINQNNIANINPFRYRGYYYDIESGLYYLMSRYYDPQIGQFISPDTQNYLDPQTIGGVDLYAYCGNNPVMRVDSKGTSWISINDRFTNDFAIGNGFDFDLTLGNPYSRFINNLLNAFKTIGNNLATFFVDTVWNNGIVPAWNWVANPDNLIWLLGGISTVVGGAITIIGVFIQLPIAVTVVGVVLAVVGIAVFIWDIIRRFSN